MRIAMLTNNYKPFIGGVPISIERLADGLKSIGHDVFIFAPSYENQVEEENVIRCKSIITKTDKYTLPNMFDVKLEKRFKELNIDIIHVHHPILMGNLGLYLGKKYNVPVVFTYHTRYEQYLHYVKVYNAIEERRKVENNKNLIYIEDKILNYTKNNLTCGYLNKFANKCDMIFAPTNLIKEQLQESGIKSNIQVIPTGLDESYFKEEKEVSNAIRKKYIQDKKYLFCTVARLVKEKNLEFLIRGLKELKSREGDCFKSLIIGEGPLKENLKSLAKKLGLEDNIVFLNSVSNDCIGNYYRACDLFLFSSQSETQGIVLLEAMAAKKPVVAVKASGVIDVVKNNINGYITDNDEKEWANKVSYLLSNDSIRKDLSKGAYYTSLQYMNSNIAKQVEENYIKVMTEHFIHRLKTKTHRKIYINRAIKEKILYK